jgi:hypothetical protein
MKKESKNSKKETPMIENYEYWVVFLLLALAVIFK